MSDEERRRLREADSGVSWRRWGEDGLAGISDDKQLLCLALALGNQRDPILKERLSMGGQEYTVNYLPAESDTGMFGGNSNWRGPVWVPINVMLIRALLNLYMFAGDEFTVECPTGSGKQLNLFYEYYHGDNGAGIGASHQTGWSGTVGVLALLFRGSIFREQSPIPARRAAERSAPRPTGVTR